MESNMEVLPKKAYRPVRLRHVLPVDEDTKSIRVAFTLSHGTIFGLDLELESARVLSGLLTENLKRRRCEAYTFDESELNHED